MAKIALTGTSIAAAVASLLASGCTYYDAKTGDTYRTQDGEKLSVAGRAGDLQVRCYGANACKGQGSCKTANNACKGQNECKGQGFMMMEEMACIDHFGRA